ncbi:hypothetical protein M8J77_007921 [Diaphorina citri]|nr:hypothetical protein M8J77_007921 [Diaphorina citri]
MRDSLPTTEDFSLTNLCIPISIRNGLYQKFANGFYQKFSRSENSTSTGGLHAWHAVTEKSMRLGRGARTPDRPVSHASGRDVLTFTRSRGDATTPEEDDEATLRALLIR